MIETIEMTEPTTRTPARITPERMTDREVARRKYHAVKSCIVTQAVKFGPMELPEPDTLVQERRFYSRRELLDACRTGEFETLLDRYDLVTMLGHDGKFAVDLIAKKPTTRTEGEHLGVAAVGSR